MAALPVANMLFMFSDMELYEPAVVVGGGGGGAMMAAATVAPPNASAAAVELVVDEKPCSLCEYLPSITMLLLGRNELLLLPVGLMGAGVFETLAKLAGRRAFWRRSRLGGAIIVLVSSTPRAYTREPV